MIQAYECSECGDRQEKSRNDIHPELSGYG